MTNLCDKTYTICFQLGFRKAAERRLPKAETHHKSNYRVFALFKNLNLFLMCLFERIEITYLKILSKPFQTMKVETHQIYVVSL